MDGEGISMEEFKAAFEKGHMFASGIGTFDQRDTKIMASS